MASLYDWIDERTGVKKISRAILDEPIRGGARLAYVFGSALIFLFLLQAATGIFLTMYYVPSADHAHVSVAYIQKVVPMGSIIRGLHSYGASAMIIILVAHLTQTYIFGAYKQRRELLWIVGIIMLLIVLGFAFTGYLLPWDQEAYFGTKVGTSVAGEVPVAGELMQRILLGGHDLTTLTLSRFLVIHIFLLPLALMGLVVFHLYFFRRAGAAGPYHHQSDASVEFFYPNQLFKDMVFIFVMFLVLLILSLTVPARLGPQADPTSDFLARPPWYFLPLFQLLKYFPGELALIPIVGLPTALFGALFLLPFIDRRPERHPRRRPIAISVLVLGLGGSVVLGALSKYQDAAHPEFSAKLHTQEEEARAFLNASFVPQEIGRSIPVNPPVVKNPPVAGSRVLKIYFANCANCHGADAMGGAMAPALVSLAKNRRLTKSFLVDYLVGHKREPAPGSMPRFKQLTPEDREAIAEWLLTLHHPIEKSVEATEPQTVAVAPSSSPAKKGQEVAEAVQARNKETVRAQEVEPALPAPPAAFTANCAFCHGPHGEGNIGPSLVRIIEKPNRRQDDLFKLLTDSRQFGLKDPMPAGFPTLSDEDRKQIIEWLSQLK
jgi:ubiquinol-cytochrome c reductase cytochrome b subunit